MSESKTSGMASVQRTQGPGITSIGTAVAEAVAGAVAVAMAVGVSVAIGVSVDKKLEAITVDVEM